MPAYRMREGMGQRGAAVTFDLAQALRDGGGEVARVLKRAERRRLTDPLRRELVEWAGWTRINRGLSAATAGNYVDDVAEFLEWIGARGVAVEAVGQDEVNEWQQELFVSERESAATRALKLTALRMFYLWRGGTDPTQGIRGPKVPVHQPRKYSTQQLRRIFAACDTSTPIGRRDYAVLLTIYTTGARRDEMTGMDLGSLDLRERGGRILFTGKGAKERTVPFEIETARAIRDWLSDRDALAVDRDAVWLRLDARGKGQRMGRRGLYQVIARALARAKVRVSDGAQGLHRLRASFATDLYDAGTDIRAIRILMGHEDINTTERYIAVTERQMRKRMPTARVREVTGRGGPTVPMWARRPGVMAKLQPTEVEE